MILVAYLNDFCFTIGCFPFAIIILLTNTAAVMNRNIYLPLQK